MQLFLGNIHIFSKGNSYVQVMTCNKQQLLYLCSAACMFILKFLRWFNILYQQLKAELAPKAGTPYIDGERCLLCQKERYERGKKG